MGDRTLNLLFLYTDQQASKTLAAYGNGQIQMPRLNALANESVLFEHAYVTQPVCTPSRSSLLTGLYPHTTGCTETNVPLRPATLCLPEMIEPGKYATGHFGKWHLGDELFAQHGFDDWISIEDNYNRHFTAGRDRSATSSYHDFLIGKGVHPRDGVRFARKETARLPEELSKPAFLAAEASRFIRAHRGTPFILFVNFLEPHPPYFGPRNDLHSPHEIPLPSSFASEPAPGGSTRVRLLREHFLRHGHGQFPLRTEDDWRRVIANYWGLCSLADTYVGKILDTLEECGLRDNTVVVFTSDHGDMLGAHRLMAKTVMYQEAIRVPLLIRLPGQQRPVRVRGPMSHIDLLPTILDILGQPLPGHLQGRTLCAELEWGRPEMLESVFVEWNGRDADGALGDLLAPDSIQDWAKESTDHARLRTAICAPVRTAITPEGWKLNWSAAGEHELFDLRDDPGETENLFEAYRSLARRIAGEIQRWQERTGDSVALPGI